GVPLGDLDDRPRADAAGGRRARDVQLADLGPIHPAAVHVDPVERILARGVDAPTRVAGQMDMVVDVAAALVDVLYGPPLVGRIGVDVDAEAELVPGLVRPEGPDLVPAERDHRRDVV